jgi:hypothetical protein
VCVFGGGCYFGFPLAAVSECGIAVGICLSVCLLSIPKMRCGRANYEKRGMHHVFCRDACRWLWRCIDLCLSTVFSYVVKVDEA